ncbi:MAG: lamin tail domain-containing protein, partial [Planctomycetota bacterium]
WAEPSFHANTARTAWTEGPSGYGYSNEADELQFIRTPLDDMPGNYMSVYARLSFTLTFDQIVSFSALTAEVHYDDGFVLYLNGVRVADSGQITGNPPRFNQSGGPAADPPAANIDLTSRINLLRSGTNVLAIQANNASLSGSSDCLACPILRAVVGEAASVDAPSARVVINELLANSDAAAGADWIELYNPGLMPVDLSNVYLSDDRQDLLKYKIPNGTILQPGQFWAVSQGMPPLGFAFGLDFAGETVHVTVATGDINPVPLRVLDAVRYEALQPEVTLGRYPDGSARLCRLTSATFAGSNSRPTVGDIVINEIMYHHGTRDGRYEYVELYNGGRETVNLAGWAFTDGINYEFGQGVEMSPGSFLVIAKEPDLLETVYENLSVGVNLLGPFTGQLNDHSERLCLSQPLVELDPDTGRFETYMVVADEVTYFDGGRWPTWADGQGASLELRDPRSENDTPGAWADSDESDKTTWEHFSFTIDAADSSYTHDQATIFDLMLLNRGEILIDDLSLIGGRLNILKNPGFESAESGWRRLGNHVQSFATTADSHSGTRSLHLIATGHGDPGANRINQSIGNVSIGKVTFSGWARWLRGSRFLLLRTAREQAPVQPPRPSHAFELTMPLNLGTPGEQNTAFAYNRGPDILDVRHAPVLPAGGQPIVVTARITDNDGIGAVRLYYRSEGASTFAGAPMRDDGAGGDAIGGDSIFTATIPGASNGTMRAFYIEASDRSVPNVAGILGGCP